MYGKFIKNNMCMVSTRRPPIRIYKNQKHFIIEINDLLYFKILSVTATNLQSINSIVFRNISYNNKFSCPRTFD